MKRAQKIREFVQKSQCKQRKYFKKSSETIFNVNEEVIAKN